MVSGITSHITCVSFCLFLYLKKIINSNNFFFKGDGQGRLLHVFIMCCPLMNKEISFPHQKKKKKAFLVEERSYNLHVIYIYM